MEKIEELQINEVEILQSQKYYLLLYRYENSLIWDGSQMSTDYNYILQELHRRKKYDKEFDHKTEYKIVSFTMPL